MDWAVQRDTKESKVVFLFCFTSFFFYSLRSWILPRLSPNNPSWLHLYLLLLLLLLVL